MWVEIVLSIASNISALFTFITAILACASIISLGVWVGTNFDPDPRVESSQKAALRAVRIFVPLFLISMIIAVLPTPDDLWKVRVSLIKYHLASPENLQKGVEAIERIGKQLECRYLGSGCPETKKEAEKK